MKNTENQSNIGQGVSNHLYTQQVIDAKMILVRDITLPPTKTETTESVISVPKSDPLPPMWVIKAKKYWINQLIVCIVAQIFSLYQQEPRIPQVIRRIHCLTKTVMRNFRHSFPCYHLAHHTSAIDLQNLQIWSERKRYSNHSLMTFSVEFIL